ncbi:MAG: PAS domain-containing protein [Ferruginibacter sp.]
MPELIWTTDSNGVQDFASNKWKEFTGIDPREDTSFEKMIHPDDLEPLTKNMD